VPHAIITRIWRKREFCDYAFQVILLVGKKGNLSLALQQMYKNADIRIVGSDIASRWAIEGGDKEIEGDLKKLGIFPEVILNAAGEINSNTGFINLCNVNFYLPKNLETFSQNFGATLVTFGTIMENLIELSSSNPYLLSKRRYFEYITEQLDYNTNSLHLQIHTWYGVANPHKNMFLSQMIQALKNKEIFHMSNGNQLREYHHIQDDMVALQTLLNLKTRGVIQMNHGETVSLKDLATTVFDYFDSAELLKIGSINTPKHEITTKNFERNTLFDSFQFRVTKQGVTSDFERILGRFK
jgi:nucleoside-diphosphate-sugar epimerase